MRAILFSSLTSLFLHCCFGLLKLLLRIRYNENTFSDAEFYFEFPVDKPDDCLFTADIANRFIIFRRIERKSYLVREIFRRFVIIDDHNPVVTIFCGNVFAVKRFLLRSKRNGISRPKRFIASYRPTCSLRFNYTRQTLRIQYTAAIVLYTTLT